MLKTCFKCSVEKPIDKFYLHVGMADGRLNKCKACCHADDVAYRVRRWGSLPAFRKASYERELELGTRTRVAPQKIGRDPVARRATVARYGHKRRARSKLRTDLDQFVFAEAIRLCAAREKTTSIKWSLDHVVPLNHKDACGLHNAFNFQVVPMRWNELKRNKTMDSFWPMKRRNP